MRTIVQIPEPERGALDALARRLGVSRAELVRRAIRHYLEGNRAGQADVFGLWRDRTEDGLEYQHRLREEWRADR